MLVMVGDWLSQHCFKLQLWLMDQLSHLKNHQIPHQTHNYLTKTAVAFPPLWGFLDFRGLPQKSVSLSLCWINRLKPVVFLRQDLFFFPFTFFLLKRLLSYHHHCCFPPIDIRYSVVIVIVKWCVSIKIVSFWVSWLSSIKPSQHLRLYFLPLWANPAPRTLKLSSLFSDPIVT